MTSREAWITCGVLAFGVVNWLWARGRVTGDGGCGMTPLSLVLLAAGMGSRYGGLKQLDPVGPHGETLMDYSIHDALLARIRTGGLRDPPRDRAGIPGHHRKSLS